MAQSSDTNKKIVIGVIAIGLLIGAYFYFTKKEKPVQAKTEEKKVESADQDTVSTLEDPQPVVNHRYGIKSGVIGVAMTTLLIFLVFAVVLALLGWAFWAIRNKYIFNQKCRLVEYWEDGSIKITEGLKGGFVKNDSGVRDFKVKIGKLPWNTKTLGYSPITEKTDRNGVYTLIKIGDGSQLQQGEIKIKIFEEIDYIGIFELYIF
jgi:hypothetical protein